MVWTSLNPKTEVNFYNEERQQEKKAAPILLLCSNREPVKNVLADFVR